MADNKNSDSLIQTRSAIPGSAVSDASTIVPRLCNLRICSYITL